MTFTIIAHRGDSANAPENTLAAFDAAVQQGWTNFETDAQLSSDGKVVILHDEQLGRTNSGAGRASEHTLEQLQQLDAGSWFGAAFASARIPTLSEVLQRYQGRAHIHLELKSQQPELPAAVADLIQQHGWHNLVSAGQQQLEQQQQREHSPAAASSFKVPGLTVTSFHLQQLQASKQLLPSVPHGWLIQEVTDELIAVAKASGFAMLCPRANALTAGGVRQILQQDLVVRAWGVKTLKLLHHVVACAVDGATVNWPAQAAAALQQNADTAAEDAA